MKYSTNGKSCWQHAFHVRYKIKSRRLAGSVLALILYLVTVPAHGQTGLPQPVLAQDALSGSPVIVIGFVGGFIKRNDIAHAEVQLAARLRKSYPSGVDVETFENRNGEEARKKILELLDANHDGTLSSAEKKGARIILYGHSWGASEAIAMASELEKDGIPVLLTVQVDSVPKRHQNDALIPANVVQAANFYQPSGRLHGQPEIRAANPRRTNIIGNFRFDYTSSPYTCKNYPWYDRIFGKSHTQIECDPIVWERAESLIRAHVPATAASGPQH